MNTISQSPTFMGKSLSISSHINKGRKYLYNDITTIINKNQMPAVFSNDKIVINMPEFVYMQDKIMNDLTKAGVSFDIIG